MRMHLPIMYLWLRQGKQPSKPKQKAQSMQNVKFSKIQNTRSIGPQTVVTGQAAYSPQATSTRLTNLSWAALTLALKAGKGKCTVQAYITQQAITNPTNVGDALPCLRYWASNGKIAIAA